VRFPHAADPTGLPSAGRRISRRGLSVRPCGPGVCIPDSNTTPQSAA
jgi:hypothetical protein